MNKKILIIGSIVYFLLALLSLYYYLERTVFLDISYHLFFIIKDGFYAIQNMRFGAFVTQTFPLLGTKLGLDLESIMKLYSVGFEIYYFLIFALCILWTKSYRFALVMLLFSVLMVTDTFYWIQSEFPQGLAILVLLFSYLYFISTKKNDLNGETSYAQYFIGFLFVISLVFFHPLMLIPFSFFVLFFYYDGSVNKKLLMFISASFFAIFIFKSIFFRTAYDRTSLSVLKNIYLLFPNYIFIETNKDFLISAIQDYYFLILGLAGVLFYYFKEGQRMKFLLVAGYFIAYLLLINVSYVACKEPFYIENLHLPLSLFVIVPLVFDFTKTFTARKIIIALVFVCLIRVIHIGFSNGPYTDRLNYLSSILEETAENENKKLILKSSDFSMDTLYLPWASPYEFWLLSTISTGETRSILIMDDPQEMAWTRAAQNKFLTKWGVFDYNELPEKYFPFKDKSSYSFLYE